ncbi:MAG: diguanylate cyclase [Deltaproteobacteria bacterium]
MATVGATAGDPAESRKYMLSISIGCSCYDPENTCSMDELMAEADQLMYAQKRRKKSCSI